MWSIIPTAHWITKSHPKKIVGELSSLGLHLTFLRSEICDFLSFHWSLSYKKNPKDTFVGQAYGCTKSLNLKRQKRPELWRMLSPYIRTFACCLRCYHAGAPFQGYRPAVFESWAGSSAAQNHLSGQCCVSWAIWEIWRWKSLPWDMPGLRITNGSWQSSTFSV